MPNGSGTALGSATRGNGSREKVRNGALTSRQEEVLLFCERKGYYEIPRRKTLRSLAAELGISVTSLSLIVRRAEAKLVHDFAGQMAEASQAPLPLSLGRGRR